MEFEVKTPGYVAKPLPLTSCVTLGKYLPFSGPWFLICAMRKLTLGASSSLRST